MNAAYVTVWVSDKYFDDAKKGNTFIAVGKETVFSRHQLNVPLSCVSIRGITTTMISYGNYTSYERINEYDINLTNS